MQSESWALSRDLKVERRLVWRNCGDRECRSWVQQQGKHVSQKYSERMVCHRNTKSSYGVLYGEQMAELRRLIGVRIVSRSYVLTVPSIFRRILSPLQVSAEVQSGHSSVKCKSGKELVQKTGYQYHGRNKGRIWDGFLPWTPRNQNVLSSLRTFL